MVILSMHIGVNLVAQVNNIPQVNTISKQDSAERTRMEYEFAFSEGAKQKMLGNMDLAAESFTRCVELKPEKPAPYYELSGLTYLNGDAEAAKNYAEQAIERDPANEWYKYLAIEIATQQERYIDGAEYYKQLYQQFKERSEYRRGEIDMLIKAGDFKNALKRLNYLEKEYGYSKYIAIRKKNVFLATGKEKPAYRELEKMIKEFPDEVEIMGILAELYAENGEEEKALALFDKMKGMNSGNPLVYFSLGQYYLELDRKEEAIAEFQTGFASKEVNPDIKIQVFIELLKSQSIDEKLNNSMEGLLEVLYKTDRGNPNVDVLYADYLFNLGREEEAEKIYKRIIKIVPSNFLAWQNLLFIQNNQLDFEEMFAIASEATINYPNQPFFQLFKGIGASQTNKLQLAIESLNTGLSINVNNAELTKQFYISLGDTYYQMGEYQQAFKNFENLLALDPDNLLVLNNYSYYLSILDQNIDKALGMIEKCIKTEGDNATYLDTYAWVLFKKKEYSKALEFIEKAISLNESPSGEVLEHYGDILFRNNQPDKAHENWKKARDAGGASEDITKKIESGLE